MNENEFLAVVDAITASLESGKPAVLATVIEREGSGPRQAGARMAITPDGTTGTVGGGGLEASAVSAAEEVLKDKQSRRVRFVLDNNDVTTPGMMCGGRATVLLAHLDAASRPIAFFQDLQRTLQENAPFIFVTLYDDEGDVRFCLLLPDGTSRSSSPMAEEELARLRVEAEKSTGVRTVLLSDATVLLEDWRGRPNLYCFGAGHVARPTARLAATVGFRVTVLDDRPDFTTGERFPDAEVRVIDEFETALQGLDIGAADAIVIVTRDHRQDYTVLREALKTDAGYIGMIASRRKRELVFDALRQAGVSEEDLSRTHAPIGLEIGAETPEEIAVSIVAELIKERAGRRP